MCFWRVLCGVGYGVFGGCVVVVVVCVGGGGVGFVGGV